MYKDYWSTASTPTWNSWFIPECIDAVTSSKGNGSSLGVCLLIKGCATKSEDDLMKKENDWKIEKEKSMRHEMNKWTGEQKVRILAKVSSEDEKKISYIQKID